MIQFARAAMATLAVAIILTSAVCVLSPASVAYARDMTPTQAATLLKEDPHTVVLDIRTPREFRSGHIEGAINIDYYSSLFQSRLAKLDRNKTYLMHCAAGGRSDNSLRIFRKLGFKSVIHMPGGMNSWKRARLKVVK